MKKQAPATTTEWLAFSNALITVCSDLQAVPVAVPEAVDGAVPTAGQIEQVPRKKAAGRTLEKEQVTAIHRYATSMGLDFSEVSLEEVQGAPGGVAAYAKMTTADATQQYKDSQKAQQAPRQRQVFPILEKRPRATVTRTYKGVLAYIGSVNT